MFQRKTSLLLRSLLLALAVSAAACDTTPGPSLYDETDTGAPAPVIAAVEPAAGWLAGIGTLTITGSNFSANPADNLVYFDAVRAEVLEAAPTRLVVATPNLPKDAINVRVSVLGAPNFSNALTYRLEPAVEEFGDIAGFEQPFAITTDDAGNLYVSLFANNVSAGIKRITPEGARSDYVTTTFKWDDLAVGPDGFLYGARGLRALFRFPPGGGAQQTWVALPTATTRLSTIDFDPDGNLWAAGNNPFIFRIAPDQTVAQFPFEASVRAVEIFGGHLYAAADQGGVEGVWRFPLGGGTLGAPELYLNVTERYDEPDARILALAFAQDGTMYLGTDGPDGILTYSTTDQLEPLYPGLFLPTTTSFAWGEGSVLYATREGSATATPAISSTILRINTQRAGAP